MSEDINTKRDEATEKYWRETLRPTCDTDFRHGWDACAKEFEAKCAEYEHALGFYANGVWTEKQVILSNGQTGTTWNPIFSLRNDHGIKAREVLAKYREPK